MGPEDALIPLYLMHNMKDLIHYSEVMMDAIASQITILPIVYSTVYSGTHQLKHPSSASLVFVPGIQRWPVNSPHKGPVTRKMFPFDDAIMIRPYDTGHVTRNLPAIMFFMLRKRSAEATNLTKKTLWFKAIWSVGCTWICGNPTL